MKERDNINSMGHDAHLAQDSAGQQEIAAAMDKLEKMKVEAAVVDEARYAEEPEEETQEAEVVEELPEEPEEEAAEVVEEEAAAEPPKEKKKHKKPWNPVKEQFVLHDALEKKEQENAYLRSLLDQSKNVSAENYGALIEKELQDAKKSLKDALSNGDAEAMADAQVELNKIAYRQQDFYRWKADEEYQQKVAQSAPPAQAVNTEPSRAQQAVINDWNDYINENHPALVQGTRYYDPALYGEVSNMVEKYNRDLVKQGYSDAIYSVEYFEKINEGIEALNNERKQTKKAKAVLPSVPIAGVRNAYANSTQGVTTGRPKEKPQLKNDVLSIIDNFSAPWMNAKELKKNWEKNL